MPVLCVHDIGYLPSVGFFFFKQKTAYEIRISDWSSDVCSSDLRLRVDGAGRIVEERTAAEKHAGKADRGDKENADDCENEVLHDALPGSCARRPAKDTRGRLQG